MLTAAALALTLIAPTKSSLPDCAFDCFLLAGNEHQISDLGELVNSQNSDPVATIFRPTLVAMAKSKTSYVVVDAGDWTVFPDTKNWAVTQCFQRSCSTINSRTETVQVHGKPKTTVLETTSSESTTRVSLQTKPIGNFGYISTSFINFNNGETGIALQDLNSYRASRKSLNSQDRQSSTSTLLLSRDSVETSIDCVTSENPEYNGLCICQWGLPNSQAPNFLVFPPKGVISHYHLERKNDRWSATLVEYLR